ncbi:MAG: methionyl-tRNA synthetase [Puniceicoccaceae bacterium 5H]|nr:MAG: methionyl-tRNA synthetase [Puniceicoccaceae bacterium 5H]
MKHFYITTAIDYANGSLHIGHAYEKVLTDVIARYRRLMGDQVHYLTGLDEHGQKVQQKAASEGVEPQAFVDNVAVMFGELIEKLNISNDDFIRTTQPRHKRIVQHILQDLYDRGEIYQGEYKGYYSVRQEQFVAEKERNEDGSWPELYGEVVELVEKNYYFRLSKYQDWLIEFLQQNPDFVLPNFRQKQVLEFLKEPINDLCITRPKERLSWGIPMPFDEDYVTYVWFDALINYLSATGWPEEGWDRYWPADYHVIGKDILVPAHSIYWPIMLHAMQVPLPKHLLVHGWWLAQGGSKISKSAGNAVDPLDFIDEFSADAFRYFLTREMNVAQDSEYSRELFLARYNGDLGNNLGNLVSRLLNMAGKNCADGLPAATRNDEPEQNVKAHWEKTREEVLNFYEEFQFHLAMERVMSFCSTLNNYLELRQPWKLAKSDKPEDRETLNTSLAVVAEGLRLATVFLKPVMPTIADRIQELLGQPAIDTWEDRLDWGNRLEGQVLGAKTILFPRPQPPAES